jgi:glycosyltransferase involved in cell wall biosynthesis
VIVGIDASNIKDSGGLKHLIEFLTHVQPQQFGVSKIIVFGGEQLDQLPDNAWLEKRKEKLLSTENFIKETFWKVLRAEKAFMSNCDIIFAPGGTFFSKKIPYVSMSQNMLVFEKEEADRYGFSWIRLRLYILNKLQRISFNDAKGVIFISQYAQKYITLIPEISIAKTVLSYFGSSDTFKNPVKKQHELDFYNKQNPYKILYVSIVNIYKHQDKLVQAINILYERGYPIELILVGPSHKPSLNKLNKTLSKIVNHEKFIKYLGQIKYDQISSIYKQSDLFAFPSSCENMPNILIEAMSAGLPIASSNYGPMPEFLKDAGEYFDPLDIHSIANAIEKLILNPELRYQNALKAYNYAEQLSWEKCANETMEFIVSCYKASKNKE